MIAEGEPIEIELAPRGGEAGRDRAVDRIAGRNRAAVQVL